MTKMSASIMPVMPEVERLIERGEYAAAFGKFLPELDAATKMGSYQEFVVECRKALGLAWKAFTADVQRRTENLKALPGPSAHTAYERALYCKALPLLLREVGPRVKDLAVGRIPLTRDTLKANVCDWLHRAPQLAAVLAELSVNRNKHNEKACLPPKAA